MTMSLVATFKNGENKTHSWSFSEVEPKQSAKEICRTLERLTTANLFDADGIEIFKTVIDGKFVQTVETVIFGTESETDKAEEEEVFAESIQAIERLLLPADAETRTLTEKVDRLFAQHSAGTRLKNFRFTASEDLDEDNLEAQPQVVLREIDECRVVKR